MTLACEGLDAMVDVNQPQYQSCVNALRNIISMDDSFRAFDSSRYSEMYGSQSERLFRAFIFLRNQSTIFNENKLIWGIAPPRQSLPQDLLQLLDEYPDRKLNQILFHYVVQSVKNFELATNLLETELFAAEYNKVQRSVSFSIATLKKSEPSFFIRVFKDVMILIHEARHSEGSHQVICFELLEDSIECDMDMNGSHGWEFTYAWALLEANEEKAWKPYQAVYMAEYLFRKLQFIQSLHEGARPLRNMAEQYRLQSEESFRNAYFIPYQEVLNREQLTPFVFSRNPTSVRFSEDYYTKTINFCPLNQMIVSSECRKFLDELIGLDTGRPLSFLDFFTKDFLRYNMLVLLQTSLLFPYEKKVLGVLPSQNLIASDLQFLKEAYKEMSWNQLLFNYIIESLRRKPEQYFLLFSDEKTYPQNIDTSMELIGWLLRNARMLLSKFHQQCEVFQNTPECLPTNQALGFEMSFRWAMLKTNERATQAGKPLLDVSETLFFAKIFCDWFEKNRVYMALYQMDQIWSGVPPISCNHDVLKQLAKE